jgi:PDZ domain-containing protein
MVALHLVYHLKSGPYHGTYEQWDTTAGFYRETTDIPGVFHEDTAIAGRNAWTEDVSGVPHALSGDELAREISKAYEGKLLLDPSAPRTTPAGGMPLTVLVDPHTGLPQVFEREPRCGPAEKEIIQAWTDVAGHHVPRQIERTEDTLTLESVESLDISPEFFDRPAVRLTTSRRSVRIRFQGYGFHLFVPASIGAGPRSWLVFDTGADLSFVSQTTAAKSRLTAATAINASGSGGSVQAGMVPNVVAHVGRVAVPLRTIAIIPDSDLSKIIGRRLEGGLGYDVISRFVIRIDWPARTLTLYDPSHFRYSGAGAELPLSFRENNILVPIGIELPNGQRKNLESVIDTGSSGALSFRATFVTEAHLLEAIGKTVSTHGHGVGGASETSIGRISALRLGPYEIKEPVVELSHASKGTESGCATPASIGMGLLSRFVVYLDYARNRIILEPTSHLHDPFEYDMSGMELEGLGPQFSRVTIESIRNPSPASAAGLRPGDVIVAIDHKKLGPMSLAGVRERMRTAGPVRITVRRGGTHEISVDLKLRPLI